MLEIDVIMLCLVEIYLIGSKKRLLIWNEPHIEIFWCMYHASCTVYYPDQQMHNIYIHTHTHTHTHTYIHTYIHYSLPTPWCSVLLEKLTGLQLVKKFPTFHGTRRFITALSSLRHLSPSWASPIQSIYPHPTSWRSILILSTHLCLGLPSGLFPSGFPTKTLYTPPPLLTHMHHMPSPSHSSRFYHPHNIGWGVQII